MVDKEMIERDAREKWDADASLRAEFGEFSRYIQWRMAAARGSVRVFGSHVSEDGELAPRDRQ